MYETLLAECEKQNIIVQEKTLMGKLKGLYCDNVIWIDKKIKESNEKNCILAEELGHHYTSFGDILDQSSFINRKQELRARRWAYEKLIPLDKLIQAKKEGITNRFELAEYLDVTEDFLQDSLNRYKEKYGICIFINGYNLFFDPLEVTS